MHTALQLHARPDEREQPLLDGAVGTESKADRTTDDERSLHETHAFAELKAGAGSQFDPALVEVFVWLRPRLESLWAEGSNGTS